VQVGRGKPLLPAGLDTQHGWQLRCNDQQRCRLREPHQHRGTDEVEQPAKTHEAEYDLQRARQQGQPDGQLDPVGAAGLGQAMQ